MYITATKTRQNFDINNDFRKINFRYYSQKHKQWWQYLNNISESKNKLCFFLEPVL